MSKLRVIQTKSGIGRPDKQRATLRGLGLRKIREERFLEDTPEVRGMINAVRHLVSYEIVEE
jgi:large subunit ribosomal protein L30